MMICSIYFFNPSASMCVPPTSPKPSLASSLILHVMSKVHPDIILGIPIVYLVPFPLLNPNWSSPHTSSMFFPILLPKYPCYYYCCMCDEVVCRSLHFSAFGFLFKTIIATVLTTSTFSSSIFHSDVDSYDYTNSEKKLWNIKLHKFQSESWKTKCKFQENMTWMTM
jgi:hypothetical protein